MSKWTKVNNDCNYVDFDKELYSMPDKGNTSVDIRLTFDTDSRTCYYTISLHNDDGTTRAGGNCLAVGGFGTGRGVDDNDVVLRGNGGHQHVENGAG